MPLICIGIKLEEDGGGHLFCFSDAVYAVEENRLRSQMAFFQQAQYGEKSLSRPEAGSVFHSDRGAQYTSHRFQQLLHNHTVTQSFSNSGKPHDNTVAKSFFASRKKEELYRRNHPSEAAFKKSVASYIEFYNTLRPHHAIKNRTPAQIEASYTAASSHSA